MGEMFAGLSAIKTAFDLALGLKNIQDAPSRDRAINELGEKILAARGAQASLLDEISDLERDLLRLKAWDSDRERYVLNEVSPGVFAYTLRKGKEGGEPPHMLCANCYQHREKSILQATQEIRKSRRVHICPNCDAEYEVRDKNSRI